MFKLFEKFRKPISVDVEIVPYNKNALNPGGLVYALYKVYPSDRFAVGHIGRTTDHVPSRMWFIGYFRSEEDYGQYLEDPDGCTMQLKQVSDYGIPESSIADAKRDRDNAEREKVVRRIRRKFHKRHPSADEIQYRKELARIKRRNRRYRKKGMEPPPTPLICRRFPSLFDMQSVPLTTEEMTTEEKVRFALRYLYQ